ncbi:MAG TPA: EAL domain-containing protein [Candidatus Aquabacterium excrementipullorum]|nr:EAL domain-containing protein [Candidatus Aquabacterium excrementipullorum]
MTRTNDLQALLSCLKQDDATITTAHEGGFILRSAFQPIYSLSHCRAVGHEALLRATDTAGQPVPPPDYFATAQGTEDRIWIDNLTGLLHIANFAAHRPQRQWLFLNTLPESMLKLISETTPRRLAEALERFGLPASTVVLEVLENAFPDAEQLTAAVERAREIGFLIALDDFGAGHSNFDRVWQLRPDIVKLDRSLVARAAVNPRERRVVTQMVSLLHECGALVLMEGVETVDEALLALEADVDMVQGYHFCRPQPLPETDGPALQKLNDLHQLLLNTALRQRQEHKSRIAAYYNAIGHGAFALTQGHTLEEACRSFLSLPQAEVCYLLDDQGFQIGTHVLPPQYSSPDVLGYEPLNDCTGATWARRPYFRRAMQAIGKVQVTRPYRTIHGNRICVTVSMAFRHVVDGQERIKVLCGDLIESADPARVG